MAAVEQLAQARAEVRQQFGEVQRLASQAQRVAVPTTTYGGQVDPRDSQAATSNGENGRSSSSLWQPLRILNPRWKVRSQGWRRNRLQSSFLRLSLNTARGKALTLVGSAEKHHGRAAWKRIKTEHQFDAAGRNTTKFVAIIQLDWDSRGAANTFLDQLMEWERRMQEFEGESRNVLRRHKDRSPDISRSSIRKFVR